MSTTRHRWGLVILLLATATASYISRVNVSTAGPLIMREYGLTQVEMGRVFSAFLLGYVVFQVPAGLLADRFGAGRILSWASLCWFGMTMLAVWLAPGFSIFLILRLLLGITSSPTYPGSAKGVAQWIPPAFQARANGIVLASIGLGSALAPLIVSYVMVRHGWRTAMAVSVIPAGLVALTWFLNRPALQYSASSEEGSATVVEPEAGEKRTGFSRSFLLLTISYALQGYVGYIFVSWFYLYLVQERKFDLISGAWMSSLPWVLTIIAVPLGGWLTDRFAAGRPGQAWGRRIVPMVGLGLSGILISVGAHTSDAVTAAVALAGATALVLSVEGPFWSMMQRLSGKHSGRAGGIMNTGSNLGGFISPMLTPWMASRIGWENALHIAAVLAVAGAALWIWIGSGKSAGGHDPQG